MNNSTPLHVIAGLLVAAALFFMCSSAQAAEPVVFGPDRSFATTVHTFGVVAARADNSGVVVASVETTLRGNGFAFKSRYFFTCEQDGGVMDLVDDKGKTLSEGFWLVSGQSMGDGIGFEACKAAFAKLAKKKVGA